jgi:hypothetical protein
VEHARSRLLALASFRQAPGALPNGTRVSKRWSLPGDHHQNGDRATIRGSLGPIRYVSGNTYGYWVSWDDDPETLSFVIELKLRTL